MAKRTVTPAARPYGQGDTSWFTDARFGMFIHWGPVSLTAAPGPTSRPAPPSTSRSSCSRS